MLLPDGTHTMSGAGGGVGGSARVRAGRSGARVDMHLSNQCHQTPAHSRVSSELSRTIGEFSRLCYCPLVRRHPGFCTTGHGIVTCCSSAILPRLCLTSLLIIGVAKRVLNELGRASNTKRLHHLVLVTFNGARRESQNRGDLLHSFAFGDQ